MVLQAGSGETNYTDAASTTVELYRVAPAHTGGDVIVLFSDEGVLASGDIFTNGEGTSDPSSTGRIFTCSGRSTA